MADDKPKTEPLTGSPAESAPAPSTGGITPAQLVPLKLGGRDFNVPPELAEAYAEREKEFARGITMDRQAQQELQQYRQRLQQIQQTVQPPPAQQGPDLNTIWFTDPQQAARMVSQHTLMAARQEYALAQAEAAFWSSFDRKFPEYNDAGRISRSLASDHLQELLALPTIEQRVNKLGEYTGREILKISRNVNPGNDTPKPKPVERASGERVTPEPTEEEREEAGLPKSLGDAIRSRQRNRAKARVKV